MLRSSRPPPAAARPRLLGASLSVSNFAVVAPHAVTELGGAWWGYGNVSALLCSPQCSGRYLRLKKMLRGVHSVSCQVFVSSCRMGLRLEAMKFGVYVSIPVTLVLLTNQTDFMSYFVSKVRQRHIFQTGPLVIPPLGGSPAAASIRSVPAEARMGGVRGLQEAAGGRAVLVTSHFVVSEIGHSWLLAAQQRVVPSRFRRFPSMPSTPLC